MKIIAFILVLIYTISLLYSLIKNLQRIKTDNNIIVTCNNIISTAYIITIGITLIIEIIKDF